MRVRTIQEIPAGKTTIPRGKVVEIPPAAFERLQDRVSIVLAPWRTEAGRLIYLAEDNEAAKAAPEGIAVFTLAELRRMKGIGRPEAERLAEIKEVFPGEVASFYMSGKDGGQALNETNERRPNDGTTNGTC